MAEVIVIGGGPSGMMAAIAASKNNRVTLIEKNEKLGKKLYITGKGRCNLTNSKDISEFFNFIPRNSNFMYSSFYDFTNQDLMEFFSSRKVSLKTERGDRVFPVSDKSSDIIKALRDELIKNNVNILLNTRVKDILKNNNTIKALVLDDNSVINGDYFILCTGGKSYPQTGSTGDGYDFAKKLGHTIINIVPSIVPLEVEEEWVKELQGLALKNVLVKLKNKKNKVIFQELGELLFTHFGISGPLVLTVSSLEDEKEDLILSINMKPALSIEELNKRIQKDFLKNTNKMLKNSLNDLLPRGMIDIFIKLSKVDGDKKVDEITKDERNRLASLMENIELHIKNLRPISEAIITRGGINTKEIDPSTMKSKKISNLYFAGEVIDVDGVTGGFNLQIAFSTGFLAGKLNK